MKREKDGELYDASYDPRLIAERDVCKDICFEYNHLLPSRKDECCELIKKLLGKTGEVFLI